MPNWAGLLKEIGRLGSPYDVLRRKYLLKLSKLTRRNAICYYSGWLQKPEFGMLSAVSDVDKNGLMTTINGMDVSKGLDLLLHTPGGDSAATESIVDYLWSVFGGNVRCFVPQLAMSAGTMIACSSREIWMGKQSSLGPVDPQLSGLPAHGIVEEYKKAFEEVVKDPRTAPLWQVVVSKYHPTFVGECEKAIKLSDTLVRDWLKRNMLKDSPDRDATIDRIVVELGDHAVNLSHSRHLSATKCKEIGLKIVDLESDDAIQDAVLSIHHIYLHTLASTNAVKIIENHKGVAYILQVQQVLVQANAQQPAPAPSPPQSGSPVEQPTPPATPAPIV